MVAGTCGVPGAAATNSVEMGHKREQGTVTYQSQLMAATLAKGMEQKAKNAILRHVLQDVQSREARTTLLT